MKKIYLNIILIIFIYSFAIIAEPGEMLNIFKGNFSSEITRCNLNSQDNDFFGNPAATSDINFSSKLNFTFQSRYGNIENTARYNYVSFYRKLNLTKISGLRLGLGYMNYVINDIEERNEIGKLMGNIEDDETLILFNLSLPLRFKKKYFYSGLNVKYYTHNIGSLSANTYDFDYGIKYKYKNLIAGIVISNILENSVEFISAKEKFVRNYKWGLNYNIENSKNIKFSFLADYKINEIENELSAGVKISDVKVWNDNYKMNFLAGFDNVRTTFSIGTEIVVKDRFVGSFGYQVFKYNELGDNILLGLSWEFAGVNEKDILKFHRYIDRGKLFFEQGDWLLAERYWNLGIKYYPAGKKIISDKLRLVELYFEKEAQKEKFVKENTMILYNTGIDFFKKKDFQSALKYFTKIQDSKKPELKKIYIKSQDYIDKIYNNKYKIDTGQSSNQDYYMVTYSLYENGLYEQALKFLLQFKNNMPEKQYKQLDIMINSKLIDKELEKSKQQELDKLINETKQYYANDEMLKVIDMANYIIKNFSGFNQKLDTVEFLKKEAEKRVSSENKNRDKLKPTKSLKLKKTENKLKLEKLYDEATQNFFDYLKNKNIESLEKSIDIYENILAQEPLHRSRGDYEKAKQIYNSIKN